MTRLGREQRVHRVDPDRSGAERAGPAAQHFEIGKIPDPPIALAAQPVELRRQTPAARARTQPFRQMARSLARRSGRSQPACFPPRPPGGDTPEAIRPAGAACHRHRVRPARRRSRAGYANRRRPAELPAQAEAKAAPGRGRPGPECGPGRARTALDHVRRRAPRRLVAGRRAGRSPRSAGTVSLR